VEVGEAEVAEKVAPWPPPVLAWASNKGGVVPLVTSARSPFWREDACAALAEDISCVEKEIRG